MQRTNPEANPSDKLGARAGAFEADPAASSYLRRLRDSPQEIVSRIADEIGPRPATSLAEARAAAYSDGRLRRAGLHVSADTFEASSPTGLAGILLAALAIAAVTLYYWLPLIALLLSVCGAALAASLLARRGAPLLASRRPCQNVIATLAAPNEPRRRLVLIAPLDTPPPSERVAWLLSGSARLPALRLAAAALIVLLGLIGAFDVQRAWWYAQMPAALFLLLAALLDVWALVGPQSPGAISYAGALAVLLTAAEALDDLQQTELWAVALGASGQGAGLEDLLRRYPFDRDSTLFLALEGLGDGDLCYLTGEGWPRRLAADPQLAAFAGAVGAQPEVGALARTYAATHTVGAALLAQERRALTIACLGADGRVPRRGSRADTAERVSAETLDRAARLVVQLARRIDQGDEQAT